MLYICFKFTFVSEVFFFFLKEWLDLYLMLSPVSVEKSGKMNWRVYHFLIFESSHLTLDFIAYTDGIILCIFFPPVWNCQRKDLNMKGNECWGKIIAVRCYECPICLTGMCKCFPFDEICAENFTLHLTSISIFRTKALKIQFSCNTLSQLYLYCHWGK